MKTSPIDLTVCIFPSLPCREHSSRRNSGKIRGLGNQFTPASNFTQLWRASTAFVFSVSLWWNHCARFHSPRRHKEHRGRTEIFNSCGSGWVL
jgi:hypothetical protein